MAMVTECRIPEGTDETEAREILRKMCSDVTICSPKEGFFSHYVEQINEQVSENFLHKFGKLKTDEQRILTIWGVKPIHTLKLQSFYRQKSREFSEGRRADGNKAFQNKNYDQALFLYSQAVMRAPHNQGDSLAMAYANRSAVLVHLNHHQLAITDIQLALQAHYPNTLAFKVLDRLGQCHQKLGQYSLAKDAFTRATNALNVAQLDNKKLQTLNKDLTQKLEQCEGKNDENSNNGHQPVGGAQLFEGTSDVLPNASSAVSIQSSQQAGRFAVVTRCVPTGQVLMAEKPYAAVLMDNKNGTHCTHCYTRLVAPVPCPTCSGVAFCCPGCRDKALQSYHRWECKFMDLLKGSGVSLNAYLALRVITQNTLDFFKKVKPRLQESATLPSTTSPHRPNDYMSFYHLAGLDEMRPPRDFFQRSLLASFLLKILQRANYFGPFDDEGPPDKGLGEDEVLVGGLLLRHLQVIQFNAHELSGMSFGKSGENFKESKSVFLGLAVYLTVAFCNHSCYPGVARFFEGSKMVIVTLRPLSPGALIEENYGPIFTHTTRKERLRKLYSRYWFTCGCVACEGEWPIYDHMVDRKILRCQTCHSGLPSVNNTTQSHVKCLQCGASTNTVAAFKTLHQAQKLYDCGTKLLEDVRREEAITAFVRYMDAALKVVVPPLREIHLAMQALRVLVGARGTIHTPPEKK
ncbi:hypothetical protein Pmani_016759 [Petrolisthes manimaculis]|uniref:SET and MYND domain-containing protein 4 n=1 Tax=Petrolisthes manimaculis TaxID=1843537 RepID=A0AAE1UA58_9EUCA|nr:hypothetical protein Pmani_016759 [Petrolisthes manimaculis]